MKVKPLDGTTWPDFAALVERHNGVWGGCWRMGFDTVSMFESQGFARTRRIGKHRWAVSKVVS